MSRREITATISRDLGILKYSGETEAEYISRLTYSSLGSWARFLAAYPDGTSKPIGNIYKAAHHRRLVDILNRFILIYDEIGEYYADDDAVARIRLPLLASKDLNEVGFESRIAIGDSHTMIGGQNCIIQIAVPQIPTGYVASGLAYISANKTEADSDEFLSTWGIPNCSALDQLETILEHAKWENFSFSDSFELFDVNRKGTLSTCWVPLKTIKNDICIIRKKLSYGQYEYYLASGVSGAQVCKFGDFSQNEVFRETQRLLYALKAKGGNKLTVNVDVYQQYSVWHFWSKLPPQEERLLRYIGWPKNGIVNRTNEYVVRNEFNSILNLITNNLGVIRKEVYHE